MGGDILTDDTYHHIIVVCLNIVQNAKPFLILCQNLITVTLICVGAVTLSAVENIGRRLAAGKRHTTLSLPTKRRVLIKLKLAKLCCNWNVQIAAHIAVKLDMLTAIMKTTLSHLVLFGCADNVMLLNIEKIG